MTKRKTTPAATPAAAPAAKPTRSRGTKPVTTGVPRIRADAARRADAGTIRRALDELGIDKPYYSARVAGGRLELALYGGDIVFYPPDPGTAKHQVGNPKET